jgi:hypothetical protein
LIYRIGDIPGEIRRVGNRWGVTYDISTDKYLAWGGKEESFVNSYVPNSSQSPELGAQYCSEIEAIIRSLPPRTVSYSTFKVYFAAAAKSLGLLGLPCKSIVDAILLGIIQANVVVRKKVVYIQGGKGVRGPVQRKSKNRYEY